MTLEIWNLVKPQFSLCWTVKIKIIGDNPDFIAPQYVDDLYLDRSSWDDKLSVL